MFYACVFYGIGVFCSTTFSSQHVCNEAFQLLKKPQENLFYNQYFQLLQKMNKIESYLEKISVLVKFNHVPFLFDSMLSITISLFQINLQKCHG